jgi:hypothetical protein
VADTIFAVPVKLAHTLGSFLLRLRNSIFARYHPEQHYMRGRGPKCREKHSGARVA